MPGTFGGPPLPAVTTAPEQTDSTDATGPTGPIGRWGRAVDDEEPDRIR